MRDKVLGKNNFIFMICFFITSCTVGPDYVRPLAPMSSHFKEAHDQKVIKDAQLKNWKIAEPKDDCDRQQWWIVFHDAKLNQLELQLNQANQSLINAYYNYMQARALVAEARASFFPTLVGSLSLTRQKSSSNGTASNSSNSTTASSSSISTGGLSSSAKTPTTTHNLLLDAAWEPDIWGLVRRQVEAAKAGAEASAATFAVTRLSAQASLAQYYFELRGLDAVQKILNNTVSNDKKLLHLTLNQYTSGVASRANVVQAQSVLETAEAQAINNGIARGQYEHAIAILTGVPPAELSITPYPLTVLPPPIPLSIPSALLERRPDIAQAERLMAQANAQIGVAVSAYYPTLTLTGSANTVGNGLSHWFSLPALGWSLGSQLSDTILDGGLRSATVSAATASYRATVASYRQTVLSALQDVEDNLISLRILAVEAKVNHQAVASANLALQLVINQYKSGTVDYASVITAQITLLSAEQNAANVDYLRMTSAVGLIKALGGGWTQG
jgi:NodT family efflux transporter outer membrane factor (OMF) lipoprotein